MSNNKNIILIILAISLLALCSLSIYFLHPRAIGDSISYLDSIKFLETGQLSPNFVPNRLTTTFGGLQIVRMFSWVFGSVLNVWMAMNIIFYFLLAIAFYRLLILIFENEKIALLGVLFLVGNYSILTFGLNYLMDIGGWTFYIFSALFSFRYLKFGDRKDIILASLCVGVGGLFKEYAFLGAIPIAIILIYENHNSIIEIFKKSILPAVIATLPIAFVYWYTYSYFGYTYLDWLGANEAYYIYSSRIIEYIKSFGSLTNILSFVFIGGLWTLYEGRNDFDEKTKIFIFSIFVSILPIFFWPAITQRILFIVVPFMVIVSSFIIKKYERYFYWFLPILALYILASFFMDSFILNFVNLPL